MLELRLIKFYFLNLYLLSNLWGISQTTWQILRRRGLLNLLIKARNTLDDLGSHWFGLQRGLGVAMGKTLILIILGINCLSQELLCVVLIIFIHEFVQSVLLFVFSCFRYLLTSSKYLNLFFLLILVLRLGFNLTFWHVNHGSCLSSLPCRFLRFLLIFLLNLVFSSEDILASSNFLLLLFGSLSLFCFALFFLYDIFRCTIVARNTLWSSLLFLFFIFKFSQAASFCFFFSELLFFFFPFLSFFN